jgi:predicted AAA+ superfamily ATPase
MYERHAARLVGDALRDTPVVAINGARQVGKSTLVERMLPAIEGLRTVTMDDRVQEEAARADPHGFVDDRPGPLVIDEVQRVPELMRAIKASVDRDRRPGRFVLTGSTRLLSLPSLSEALAGRVELIDLWPLSQGELAGHRERFVDKLLGWDRELSDGTPVRRDAYLEILCAGGFPEALTRTGHRRASWFENYATTVVAKMVRDVADVERSHALPALLALCATQTGQEVNVAQLGSALSLPYRTTGAYLAHLQTVFLVRLLPAWASNLTKKIVRHPKLIVTDTGLTAHLLGASPASLSNPGSPVGHLLESFVAMELTKQLAWSTTYATLSHFRDRDGAEVDLVVEARDGRIAGIEVKAAATVTDRDFRGLRLLEAKLGDRFAGGVVLHTGIEAAPFGRRLAALPVSTLWTI